MQQELIEFPFRGPRATKEYLTSLLELDLNFLQHHMNWRVKSGVLEKSSVCRVHKSTCDALHMMMSYVQINLLNNAAAEHLIRQLILWETAVRRNPKNPDYDGLDVVLSPWGRRGWSRQHEDLHLVGGGAAEGGRSCDERYAALAGGARGRGQEAKTYSPRGSAEVNDLNFLVAVFLLGLPPIA